MFHRLTTPTYYGGLPSGADYLNTPSLSGGSGVPAYMDGKKVGGPNDGTYLFAFGEDATSNFCNRGMKALGENTDALDDLMRRDLAITARTVDVLAGSPVSTITLTGYVFVGQFGTPNTQATRDSLISILDSNDNEIITSTGVKVQALLISDGTNNVVGTQLSGFFNGPRLSLNVPIPAGVTYRVYYGERSSLATLPMDAFTSVKIRGAQEVPAEVERMFQSLHTYLPGSTWTDPWVATINSLARTGLDGKYRNSTVDPGSATMNSAGAGGTIYRDGRAVTIQLPNSRVDVISNLDDAYFPDPLLACLRMTYNLPTVDAWYHGAWGGDTGLVQESPWHSVADVSEGAYRHVTGPLVMDYAWRNITTNTLVGSETLTRITSTATAYVNPDAGSTATDIATVELALGDYVYSATGGFHGLRQNDFIEVTDPSNGRVVGTFRVDSVLSRTRILLRSYVGAPAALGFYGESTPIRLRWLQPTLTVGGRHRDGGDTYQAPPHFFVTQPSPVVADWDSNVSSIPGAFVAPMGHYHRDAGATESGSWYSLIAMGWGSYDPYGYWSTQGLLMGDGGILCSGGTQRVNQLSVRNAARSLSTGSRNINYEPGYEAGLTEVFCSLPAWNAATTFNFNVITPVYSPKTGDTFEFIFYIPDGSTGPLSINWFASIIFSGADGTFPSSNTTGNTIIIRYKFTYSVAAAAWLAERHDY